MKKLFKPAIKKSVCLDTTRMGGSVYNDYYWGTAASYRFTCFALESYTGEVKAYDYHYLHSTRPINSINKYVSACK